MIITISGFKQRKFKNNRKIVPYSELEQKMLVKADLEDDAVHQAFFGQDHYVGWLGHEQ